MNRKKPELEAVELEILTIEECILIPSMFGLPIYPGGFPTMPKHIYLNKVSAHDLFMMKCRKEEWDEDQAEFMKQYLVYYLNCPLWSSLAVEEAKLKMKKSLSFDQMIWVLLNVGLDPF